MKLAQALSDRANLQTTRYLRVSGWWQTPKYRREKPLPRTQLS